ncbi:MAG: hypothetical protein ACI808_002997 [Paraglaciecola sp.]|jgi:hypothetical protein
MKKIIYKIINASFIKGKGYNWLNNNEFLAKDVGVTPEHTTAHYSKYI